MEDIVNHPNHYAGYSVECIQMMEETQGVEALKNYCLCNAFKYLWRHNRKNHDEDVEKARWYLNKWHELMEKDNAENQGIMEDILSDKDEHIKSEELCKKCKWDYDLHICEQQDCLICKMMNEDGFCNCDHIKYGEPCPYYTPVREEQT